MVWNHPTPNESLQRIQAQIDVDLPKGDSRVRRSPEGVLARMVVMACRELLGYLQYLSRQRFVSTADEDFLPVHGSEWNIPRKAASQSIGIVQFTGVTASVVTAGSILKRSDNEEFSLDSDVVITAGTGSGTVTSIRPGASGNAAAGTKLSLTSPVSGVNSEAVVLAPGLAAGADIEDMDEWRARIKERQQRPPHGGDKDDYEMWAKQIAGVTRAWCYPKRAGVGTVSVSFVMDNKVGSIIPSVPEVAIVQEHMDIVRPATAEVIVFAPVPEPVNFEIKLSPNTIAIQNAVKAEIEDLFQREAEPGGKLYLSRIREAVSAAGGEFDNIVVAPAGNISPDFGKLPVVGAFLFAGI